AFELAQVQAPVLEHRWRLLLPENARYRFGGGDLRPALEPAAAIQDFDAFREQAMPAPGRGPARRDPWTVLQAMPGALVDHVNVGGNESGQQSAYVGAGPPPGLRGRVVDQEGSALPGATVVATSREELPPQMQVTDASGEFAFPDLAPGTYELKAELQGFSPVEVPGIRLPTREHGVRVALTLSSAVEDLGTVVSEASVLDEKQLRTGAAIGQRELQKISTARDPAAVLKDLRQGLVDGVKPLPVAVPETGKALLLAGVLPPARVAVELEVRSARK
ncbi:MAG: carboxypeptidase regulatory-like domain-containing protein, partial [Acidobacteria bacterium]|nr:carboxypeptidase regulatory-like domain-containing protein [Acidobacteriota bacterium]